MGGVALRWDDLQGPVDLCSQRRSTGNEPFGSTGITRHVSRGRIARQCGCRTTPLRSSGSRPGEAAFCGSVAADIHQESPLESSGLRS
jgi:hypothetical protein